MTRPVHRRTRAACRVARCRERSAGMYHSPQPSARGHSEPAPPSPPGERRSLALRAARRRRVERIAANQGGVVSRRDLYAAGITRGEVRANIRAGRWRRVYTQGIAIHTGPLTPEGSAWAAVIEGGPSAHLDGASSLIASGLEGFRMPRARVSVPRGARVRRNRRVDVRQTRRWDRDDVVGVGVPRSRPPVAAVRAGLWARSDKQAALLLTMAVQQRITSPEEIAIELMRVRRDRRRRLIQAVVLDLAGGVHSLGEREFTRECRRRGLPEPTRQVLRRARNGTYYLDAVFEEWGVVVEVDGIQHAWAQNVVGDALRQNDVSLQNATVLRLPLLGLRVAADEFFAQIEQALRDHGWPGRTGDVMRSGRRDDRSA